MKKRKPIFTKAPPGNGYVKYEWTAEKHRMELTHHSNGSTRWRIFEVSQENPEDEHLKEIYSGSIETLAMQKWEELTRDDNEELPPWLQALYDKEGHPTYGTPGKAMWEESEEE